MNLKQRGAEHRRAMELKHGWEVDLECPSCGYRGLPDYKGWTPGYPKGFGTRPTVFANLECPSCGRDLKPEAEAKLVEMFSDVGIPRTNRMLFVGLAVTAALLLVATALIIAFTRSILGIIPLLLLAPMLAFIPVFNRKVMDLRRRCECGDPDYVFMGMLGRAYCFHCSNCGRLLKLRD